MKTVEEYILDTNPSMKYLRLYYRSKGIFIDTTDRRVIDNLRIPVTMSELSRKDRAKKMDLADIVFWFTSILFR